MLQSLALKDGPTAPKMPKPHAQQAAPEHVPLKFCIVQEYGTVSFGYGAAMQVAARSDRTEILDGVLTLKLA
jgi:hypothetical protein